MALDVYFRDDVIRVLLALYAARIGGDWVSSDYNAGFAAALRATAVAFGAEAEFAQTANRAAHTPTVLPAALLYGENQPPQ